MTGRVGSVLAVLAAAALLYGTQRTTPLYSAITSPVPVHGEQGKRVDTDGFAIGVAQVHLARSISMTSYAGDKDYGTGGVWVVVEAAVEASRESLPLTYAAWLGPNGVRYALSRRLSNTPGMLGNETMEPGVPRPVLMVFEVPEDQLAGATLLVSQTAFTPLLPEAWIKITQVEPRDISRSITIGRGNRLLPWTLEEG